MTCFTSLFKWGIKIFRRLWCHPISPYWLVLWSGPFKHFGPLERGGGGGQALHLGAPRARPFPFHLLFFGCFTGNMAGTLRGLGHGQPASTSPPDPQLSVVAAFFNNPQLQHTTHIPPNLHFSCSPHCLRVEQ